ncbi:signal transduction histidine kinase [Rhodobium orientis]|uniref:histidine kinase n=1 Tax=Rhodobium orientis TaxID=34017 RepID=A0A327JVD1_9HYPH|nr:HAMP domain-containing sensor histidine kinase [Rhodobium orientis]MBB4303982.1 signal transduction histidine kinase [Rhodobium orientis]MBK5950808.1 histidine kinase [Rhodobium orientis]RAI29526.1 histidine kinase [Rhodobium orientis]
MLRLSLAARLSVLVIVVLLTVWLIAIALYYLGTDSDGDAFPAPERLAAIVRLVEETPDKNRPLLLESLSSKSLKAHLAPGNTLEAVPEASREIGEKLHARYLTAFGDRPVVIAAVPQDVQKRFPRALGSAVNALQFRVALAGGKVLVIDTKNTTVRSRLGLPVGFGAGLLGTVLALLALIVMHRETRPLRRLAAAADRIDLAGEPALFPPPKRSAPEIRSLVDAFNRLQTRLSQLMRARMAMLGGISHDVRTFATRLRLRLDRLPEGPERDRAIQDIADMMHLLDDALLAIRAGAGEMQQELVEFDELLAAEIEDRRDVGAMADLVIGPPGRSATVLGDRLALRRIVFNLVDNALKYGYVAHVALDVGLADAVLTVDDEGSGIPDDVKAIVTEPFVRAEASRNRATGGAGLGLTVVRSLVEAHGGTLALGNAPTGGARFTVTLPLFEAAARD